MHLFFCTFFEKIPDFSTCIFKSSHVFCLIAKELDRGLIGSIADRDNNTRIEVERIRNEIQKKIESLQTYHTLLDFFINHAPNYVDQFKMDPATAILDYVYSTALYLEFASTKTLHKNM